MKKLTFAITCALALASCSSSNDPANGSNQPNLPSTNQQVNLDDLLAEGPEGKTRIPLSDGDRMGCQKANDFAFRLFDVVSKETPADNAVISPMSVLSNLSMLANGDMAGEVRDEILGLCAPSAGPEGLSQLNSLNRLLLDYLPKLDNRSVCYFANAVMHDPSTRLRDDFLSAVSLKYNAEDIPQAPAGTDGMEAVNAWVNEKTNGMIPEFLKSPLMDQIAILNAAYFKAQWALPFNEEDNELREFENSDGSVTQTPFMHLEFFTKYAETEAGSYIEVDYGYGNYKFCALLPADDNANSMNGVSLDNLQALSNKANTECVNLYLPKFDFQSNWNLYSMLDALGLKKLAAIGLDGIAKDQPLSINTFLHSAAVKVNERGAEAGAATYSGMLMDSGGAHEIRIIDFSLDRPFLFFIKETSTDLILYMGKVNKL